MEIQKNPYLIWLLFPALITLCLGLYVQNRPRKKPESSLLSVLLFGGAFWSLANVIQYLSPNASWQLFWNTTTFIAIALMPTAWFFLAVRFTGRFRARIEKFWVLFTIIPLLTYSAILTNEHHHLFYSSYNIIASNGFHSLQVDWGILFYIHTFYSYVLIILGIIILGITLLTDFRRYGSQAFGLILGILTPLIGNIIYLYGALPPTFPDPTPICFTVTGLSFAWAIFSGRMLDVVPIAHGSVVANLHHGIVVVNGDNKILDINPAAIEILGLTSNALADLPLPRLLSHDPDLSRILQTALAAPPEEIQNRYVIPHGQTKIFELRISCIQDEHGQITGRLLQFTDISRQKQVEQKLERTQESLISILDTLRDYYFETDLNGIITNINKAFCEHLGFSEKEEILGKHFRHFTTKEAVREVYNNFSKVIETKKSIELFRYAYHTTDGAIRIGETTVSPIIEGDIVTGARGVLRDITDRLKAEDELLKTKEELEARAEELAAINRITTISNQSLQLNKILQTLCVEMTQVFPVRNAWIGMVTESKESLEVVAFHTTDPAEEEAKGMLLPFKGNSAFQEVIDQKSTLVVQDSQADPRTALMAEIFRSRGTKAIMILPLLTRGNAIGAIAMPAKNPQYIFSEKDIKLGEIIASQIAAAIDNAQLFAKTESELGIVEKDLGIGRQIQSGFFPDTIPDIPGWEFAAHFEAARQVAGDFYDFYQIEDTKLCAFVIADVCDKGVGAALYMALFRSLLRAFSKVEFTPSNVREYLRSIILNTNNYIASVHERSNMFATLFFGILNPESGRLFYINGGHEPPALLDREGKLIRRLGPTGPAVGLFPDVEFKVEQIEFNEGDFLVGYTDGTTDALNSEGELFSEERLLKYIQAPWTSLFSMVFELKTELQNYKGNMKQYDDITFISVRRKLPQTSEQHAICRVADLKILAELRDFVEAASAKYDLSHDDVLAFKLAAEEVCTNIIQHGYPDREPGVISLSFEKQDALARLIIRDDGLSFSPDLIEPPDLDAGWEERKMGGLGLYFVKQLMDHVGYSRMDGIANQWVLEKKLQPILQRV